ncbi:XisH protein [Chloroflexi bacterium TSY]|nr:XisH protein [Chloroflexi bacterium TSY]
MANDAIHDAVKQALINDDWKITAEHFRLTYEEFRLFADISARRTLVAQRGEEKILVEVKSFSGRSFVRDLQAALGQYQMYRNVIMLTELDFELYLAVSEQVYNQFFIRSGTKKLLGLNQVQLVVVNIDEQKVIQWIK